MIIAGLMMLAMIAIFTVSPAMLTSWKIHYLTTGGNVLEKFHPATYFALLAFFLLLVRNGDPVGEINRMFSEARLVAGLSRLLALPFDPDAGARTPVHRHHRHLPAAGRSVPRDLAAVAGAEKADGVDDPSHDPDQCRSRLLRIFLRPPADSADARRRPGRAGRVALVRPAGPPAHGVRPDRRLRPCAGSASRDVSAGHACGCR